MDRKNRQIHFIGANFESGIGGNGNVGKVNLQFFQSYKPATLVLFCLNLVWVLFRHSRGKSRIKLLRIFEFLWESNSTAPEFETDSSWTYEESCSGSFDVQQCVVAQQEEL